AYLSLTCTHPRLPELPDDPVLYPMPIPPFDGVHGLALEEHRVVQVIAAGEAGDARAADFGAAFDGVADVGRDRREVAVERLQAHAVVDDHAVAVDAEIAGVDDRAAVAGGDGRVGPRREVEPKMDLRVDAFAVVDVRALVGVRRLHRAARERHERAVPLRLARGLL